MIRKNNKAMILKRLKQLQSKANFKDATPIVLGLEQWLNSDDDSSSFNEYALGYEKKYPDASIIIDDMVIETDMYIDTFPILNSDRETIKVFVNLALQGDETEYMKKYIELFHAWIGVDELEPKSEYIKKLGFVHDKYLFMDGRHWTKEEVYERSYQQAVKHHESAVESRREVLSELSEPFYLDFFENYKKLSVSELVERYKDSKFFNPKD